MTSLLKKLFGGASAGKSVDVVELDAIEYKGVLIIPAPRKEGGQWRLGGILREAGGDARERVFVRADMFPDVASAAEIAVRKGKLIVDQRGPDLFPGDGAPL